MYDTFNVREKMEMNSLFKSISLGDLHLKNRIAMAPMTRGRSGSERIPNDLMAEYYYQRHTAGLLITEATVVSKHGIGWIDSPGIYTENMVEGWFFYFSLFTRHLNNIPSCSSAIELVVTT